MDYLKIIGHALGFVALVLGFISYQAKSRRKILLWQSVNSAVFVLHYLLIGAPTACVLNVVNIVRNLLYNKLGEKGKIPWGIPAVFAVLMLIFGILTWEGAHSLLVMAGIAINSVCVAFSNPQSIRKSILLTSSLVFIYDVFVLSVGGMVYELIAIGSSVIGLWRYRNEKM